MLSNLLAALEVYRAAWVILTKTEISVEEMDVQETGFGLIGPGNGFLTRLLETIFGWSSTFRLHALYHDVSGRNYFKTKKEPGYTYVFRNCIFKGSPQFGDLAGLLSCIFGGKNIGSMVVNKIYIFVFILKIPHSENSHKKLY